MSDITKWARFKGIGLLPHNIHIERYHGVIKRMLKPFMRLDIFMSTLIKVNAKYDRKDICTALSIRGAFQPSRAQKKFAAMHPTEDNHLLITEVDEKYNFAKSVDECETICTVFKNLPTCNRDLCRVTCENCPVGHCVHEYVCTCMEYALHNMCTHLHMVSQCLPRANETPPSSLPVEESTIPSIKPNAGLNIDEV